MSTGIALGHTESPSTIDERFITWWQSQPQDKRPEFIKISETLSQIGQSSIGLPVGETERSLSVNLGRFLVREKFTLKRLGTAKLKTYFVPETYKSLPHLPLKGLTFTAR